jgi:Pectate lyase superfamily protein
MPRHAIFPIAALLLAWILPLAAAKAQGCAPPPASPLVVVNVMDKGAKGDGKTDDTAAIQTAIEEVAGTGGTVLVPDGRYLIDAVRHPLKLRSKMTLKLSEGATLKAIPNDAVRYTIILIRKASKVTVTGGTLEGERWEHRGETGQWGVGINVFRGSRHVTVSGVTAKNMWGDGFYVDGAKDVTFCSVVADNNRRQGLSIISAKRLLVTDSVFKNTHGTRPSDGIDMEPDTAEQSIVDVRIEKSKFLDNAGNGIEIAGKRGRVAGVTIKGNVFRGGKRPILVENAPGVRSAEICENRKLTPEAEPSGGFNAYADPVETVSLQADCRAVAGSDIRFELKRHTKKKHKK